MRLAVINEVSARLKNADILSALSEFGEVTVYNAGMSTSGDEPELTYLQTGLMAALLLNAGACDFVVGGCGTGQGFLNSVLQYPNVVCGLITEPLDAWLFSQINAGNCVSLALNKGYGWAGELNLKLLFRELFRDPPGAGYPLARSESQAQSRMRLGEISRAAHRDIAEILKRLDPAVVRPIKQYPVFLELLQNAEKQALAKSVLSYLETL